MRAIVQSIATLLVAAPALGQRLAVRGPEPSVVRQGGRAIDGRSSGVPMTSWQLALAPTRRRRSAPPPFEARVIGHVYASHATDIERAREIAGERRAFVELSTSRRTYFVHEPIRIQIHIGIDLEFASSNLLQMFAQRLDVPVQLQVPWITELPGAVPLDEPDEPVAERLGQPRFRFVLNDAIVEGVRVADRKQSGRTFSVLEVEKTFLAERAGVLEVPGPVLRFASATRFEEGFFFDNAPVDWQLGFAFAEPLALTIQPLPEAGRPADFGGAVGRFTVRAEAAVRDVTVGESVPLVLSIEGEGNLAELAPPRLDRSTDFHVRGVLDESKRGRRRVTYDLAPLTETVDELPAIPFSYFDTSDPAGYRTVTTRPIALRVRPRPDGPRGDPSTPVGARTADTPRSSTGESPRGRSRWFVAGAGVLLIALGAALRFRRRGAATRAY